MDEDNQIIFDECPVGFVLFHQLLKLGPMLYLLGEILITLMPQPIPLEILIEFDRGG